MPASMRALKACGPRWRDSEYGDCRATPATSSGRFFVGRVPHSAFALIGVPETAPAFPGIPTSM